MSLQLTDGSVFGSRYRVVRCIAQGGMGAVYEVEHLETLRHLALKVMLPHIVQSSEMRDRFRREAQVVAHIDSDHIVAVLDAGIDEGSGSPFLVMELLRGEELSKALARRGRFTPAEVVTFLHQASLALDKTHRAFIVHRDLKPDNLFLTHREDGAPRVKVLDFGIAKLVAEGTTQDPTTRSVGTPLYMAPEQFRSGSPISQATDIYAVGMIAFALLVGSSYWAPEAANSSNVFAFAGAVMGGPRELATVRARQRGVTLPATFDAWFSHITALNPGDRFPSAIAAVAALAQALEVAHPAGAALAQPLPPAHPPIQQADPDGQSLATLIYTGPGTHTGPGSYSGPAATAPGIGPAGRSPDVAASPSTPGLGTGSGISLVGSSGPVATGTGGYGLVAPGGDPTIRPRARRGTVAAALAGLVLGGCALVAVIALAGRSHSALATRSGAPSEATSTTPSSAAAVAPPTQPTAAATSSAAFVEPSQSAASASAPAASSTAPTTAAQAAATSPAGRSQVPGPRPPTAPPTRGSRPSPPAEAAGNKGMYVRD